VLAANQGVYNGALAAALIWSVAVSDDPARMMLLVFVIAVGIYGAVSAKPTILFIQVLPAAIALTLTYLGL